MAPSGCRRILASVLREGKRIAGATAALGLLIGCSPDPPEPAAAAETPEASAPRPAAPSYAGTAACLECHADIGERWRGSDHDLAMQEPSGDSVLGDFSTEGVLLDGQRWSFSTRNGEFFALPPPEDDVSERRVAYTFGVRPLQQYLVRAEGGRLQPLPAAWDSRPAEAGGQRWMHVYEGERVRPGDAIHWMGRVQTWNHQCADCHSTALERGYDEANDRYQTSWQELDVGCEACHGPGSRHAELARGGDPEAARASVTSLALGPGAWSFAPGDPIARRSQPAAHAQRELDTCAPCHSRRAPISPDTAPGDRFLDGYLPALLDEGLYFADGRMRDEVYVWGSFAQSKMHAAGVGCSDCHDPHTLEVRGGPDAVCAGCHEPATFTSTDHHGHAPGSAGASCVACHMPERTYMQVDARRDHSLRVPRPDVAAVTGSPSVCAPCHQDRDAQWAAERLAARGALREETHFGALLWAAFSGAPASVAGLQKLIEDRRQPTIVRATAASLLGAALDRERLPTLRAALDDPDALVRLGATRALEALAPADRLALGRDRLRDAVRAVRIEAARTLLAAPPDAWAPAEHTALADALREYRISQELNADRIEGQLNLSTLEAQLGNAGAALERARRAIDFAPREAVPHINLAELLRRTGDEPGAERTLREGLAHQPGNAQLELALGLSLVRQGRTDDALAALASAHEHDASNVRVAYTYAIALQSVGHIDSSIAILEASHRDHPNDRDLLYALTTIERDRSHHEAARRWAKALLALDPSDPTARALSDSLDASAP
jgi:tetratricopeptide (TPR) repeat protein